MKKNDLPKKVAVFPLSNFIIFPQTTVPLNIFEPRYIDMINDSMETNKLIGIIQPRNNQNENYINPELHNVGCLGKITNFKKTNDGRYIIELKGIIRFKIENEFSTNKKYREFEINFDNYFEDLTNKKEDLEFSDLELIFKDIKSLFEKKGFIINWQALKEQSLNEIINALAMASPFTLEEKQILLEAQNLKIRKTKISEILTTYSYDSYNNTTIQ
jgi:Lon protease-like protein